MRTQQMPDKSLLSVILALLIFGWIMSFSASLSYFSSYSFFAKQTLFILMGLSSGLIILNTPISVLQKYSIPLFILTLILLMVVFLPSPIGHEVKGSTRWINFVYFKFQPSELMKLSMVLFMAGFLIRQEKDIRKPWIGFIKTIAIIGITGLLILLETDIGATLIIALTAMAMLYAAGSYIKQLTIVTTALFLLMAIIASLIPNRVERFMSFWTDDFWNDANPKLDQTKAALVGIARGDWFGTGLGGSIQKFKALPERHTDMIFAVIGEELGFIGMLFVLLSFLYILLKGFAIAKTALQKGRNYSSYVVFGICTWFSMQITVNIGMNLGLLPPKGFTLPLLSYGGTSMIFAIISLAIILRVDMENRTKYFKQKEYV
ncbi:FtsW/RodA/SpoVE family cell cycle protein [Candidatus Thioglobus sp. NP1]|uniref:FtsW/RodA/SpoVE family cell cycle protein n=1 Tax=Candidatus Thioglobus sp. NP1 TaxID=2508687 RepID=UPI0020C238A7|nr:putative peptidoglycan glycosyltransferase FtsW [Candidatus Thioglobus sp. NP1]